MLLRHPDQICAGYGLHGLPAAVVMVVLQTESSKLNTSFGPLRTCLASVSHLPEVFAFR